MGTITSIKNKMLPNGEKAYLVDQTTRYLFSGDHNSVPAHRHINGRGWVANDAYINNNVYIPHKSEVASKVLICNGVKIGQEVKIKRGCAIHKDSIIEDGVILSKYVRIIESTIGRFTEVGYKSYISHSNTEMFVKIGDGSRIESSKLGYDCKIGVKVRIGPDANLPDYTRICDYVRISKWKSDKAPLQIVGSKDIIYQSTPSKIGIGCKVHYINYWLKNYKHIGKLYGYTQDQIDEYYEYIKFIISRIKKEPSKYRKYKFIA